MRDERKGEERGRKGGRVRGQEKREGEGQGEMVHVTSKRTAKNANLTKF